MKTHLKITIGVAIGLAALTGCAGSPGAMMGPELRPEDFFGTTAFGQGVLVLRNGGIDRRFTVQSKGGHTEDGDFTIDQDITFDDGETRHRQWVLEKTAPGKYKGSLTEASGPVLAEVYGSKLRLSYPLEGVPTGRIEQFLYLQPDQVTVVNVGTVRIAGVTVRRLQEVIIKTDTE